MDILKTLKFYPINKKDKDIPTDIKFTLHDLKVLHLFLLEEYNNTPHIEGGRVALKAILKKLDNYLEQNG